MNTQVKQTTDTAAKTSAQVMDRLHVLRAAAKTVGSASRDLTQIVNRMDDIVGVDDPAALLAQANAAVTVSVRQIAALDSRGLLDHIRVAERHVAELRFVSVMTRIETARSAHADASQLDFAEGLRTLVKTLGQAIDDAVSAAQPIPSKVQDASRSLGAAAQALNKEAAAITRNGDAVQARRAERDIYLNQMVRDAADLSDTTAQQIARLGPAVQFTDQFTQRLNNTYHFLNAAPAHPRTAIALVHDLAARHMRALADDSREMRETAISALDVLHAVAFRAHQEMSPRSAENGADIWIRERGESVARNAVAIEAARRQLTAAFQELDEARDAVAAVSSAIDMFNPLIRSLNIEAINGAISAARSADANRASYVLAAEVQNVSRQCADQLAGSVAQLALINETIAGIDRSELETQFTHLTEELGAAKAAQTRQNALMAEQKEMRENLARGVSDLLHACRGAREAVSASESMEADLHGLASSLSGGEGVTHGADSLDWITAFYTTEPERALHQSLTGISPDDSAEDESLEGFVF